MMFGYADDRAWWQAGLMSIGMTVFWGLPIWVICSLIPRTARGPASGPGIGSTAATTRGASWASAWPAGRSAPVHTGGSARSFPPPLTAAAVGTVRA